MNLYEAKNPLLGKSWQRRGGRAIKKYSRSFKRRGRGGSFNLRMDSNGSFERTTPVCAQLRWLRDISLMGAATPPSPRRGIPAHSVFLVCCKLSDEIRISDRPDPRFSGSKDHSIWFEVRLLIRLVLIVRCRVWDST